MPVELRLMEPSEPMVRENAHCISGIAAPAEHEMTTARSSRATSSLVAN